MTSAADNITGRQLEVLYRIAQGKKTEVIADELKISVNTVLQYRKRLFTRLGVNTGAQAYAVFVQLKHPTLKI